MKTTLPRVFGVLITVLVTSVTLKADLNEWAQQAVSTDQSVAQAAQQNLRDAGPAGLEALEKMYAKDIEAHQKNANEQLEKLEDGIPIKGSADETWKPIASALNHVSGQYDDYASGLYWYTDMEKATAAAKAANKPILSLRLLGRLDEDLSCANSRFFRTMLYPNAQVNQLLKDKFVLYWETFRPVPVVTIDFGDGRKLTRTITGNSIHYVLASDGTLIDALPGLYGPQPFAKELALSAVAASSYGQKDFSVAEYQTTTKKRLFAAWKEDLAAVINSQAAAEAKKTPVDIAAAIPLPNPSELEDVKLASLTDETRWTLIANRHINEVAFDDNSSQVMASKFPAAETAAPLAISKTYVETPLIKALHNLQKSAALDTVRNNYLMRTQIFDLLQQPYLTQKASLAQVNDVIYARVFLTPKNDPWLGLAPQDTFNGIDQGGQTTVDFVSR